MKPRHHGKKKGRKNENKNKDQAQLSLTPIQSSLGFSLHVVHGPTEL